MLGIGGYNLKENDTEEIIFTVNNKWHDQDTHWLFWEHRYLVYPGFSSCLHEGLLSSTIPSKILKVH